MPAIITRGAMSAKGFGFGVGGVPSVFAGLTTPKLLPLASFSTHSLLAVAVNSSGLFVAVGFGQTGGNYYPIASRSTDGVTWSTPALTNGTTIPGSLRAITVTPSGLFVAVGFVFTGSPYAGIYATSTDGITWTTGYINNSSTAFAAFGIAVNSSGLLAAVGYNYLSAGSLYSTSSNGSTWSTVSSMGGINDGATIKGVAVNSSGLFVAVGSDSSGTSLPCFRTSSDGSTWNALTTIGSTNGILWGITVNSSGRFVAVGINSAASPQRGWTTTSTNGTSWSSPTNISLQGNNTASAMYAVSANPSGLFVAIGTGQIKSQNTGSDGTGYVTTSSDGSTWSSAALFNGSGNGSLPNGIAFNSAGLGVAVGNTNSGYGTVAYSVNAPSNYNSYTYVAPGMYSWVAPAGVTSVSVVAVGPGGIGYSCAGGGGGGLGYTNSYSVTPGNSYTVRVGDSVSGFQDSYFVSTSTVKGGYALYTTGGSYTGSGGGAGGNSGSNSGGGGAGGYSGTGGAGVCSGTAGSGSGGGGGGGAGASGGGGGVGLMGQGTNGAGGVSTGSAAGKGGSCGADGYQGYGNWGGGSRTAPCGCQFPGGTGAVRIVWPGSARQFPSTKVGLP
jgi:hypothetical protein